MLSLVNKRVEEENILSALKESESQPGIGSIVLPPYNDVIILY